MFKIRPLAIDTYPENTALLPRIDRGYGAEQFQALRKIEIFHAGCTILATDYIPGPSSMALIPALAVVSLCLGFD